MPAESALARLIGLDWTVDRELAASTLEVSHHAYRAALARAGVKVSKLPKPLRIPRPKVDEEVVAGLRDKPRPRRRQRRPATPDEVRSSLSAAFKRR